MTRIERACPIHHPWINLNLLWWLNSTNLRRISLEEQELLTIPEHLIHPRVLLGFVLLNLYCQCSVFEIIFARLLFFDHCIVSPSLNYGFWLPLWYMLYLQADFQSTEHEKWDMSDGICFNFILDRDIYSLNTETCLKCRSNLDYLITNPRYYLKILKMSNIKTQMEYIHTRMSNRKSGSRMTWAPFARWISQFFTICHAIFIRIHFTQSFVPCEIIVAKRLQYWKVWNTKMSIYLFMYQNGLKTYIHFTVLYWTYSKGTTSKIKIPLSICNKNFWL